MVSVNEKIHSWTEKGEESQFEQSDHWVPCQELGFYWLLAEKNIKPTAEDVKKDNVSESDTQNYEAERTTEFSKLMGESRKLWN